MTDLLARPVVPVANETDAVDTYDSLREYLDEGVRPLVVYVVEKARGAPDKASVEQMEEHAEEAFAAFRDRATADDVDVETKIYYGTDVAESINEAARDVGATSIVFRSRGRTGVLGFLTDDIRTSLVTESACPVVVLPTVE